MNGTGANQCVCEPECLDPDSFERMFGLLGKSEVISA